MYPIYQCSSHIEPMINPMMRNDVIERSVVALQDYEFDTLAFQGASGIGISMILAHLLHKEVIMVRKQGEPRHAYARYKVEGFLKAKRYFIIDDLIASGATIAQVIRGVRSIVPSAELAGVLLYYQGIEIITPSTDFDDKLKHIRRMVTCQDIREKKEKEQCDAKTAMALAQ